MHGKRFPNEKWDHTPAPYGLRMVPIGLLFVPDGWMTIQD